ncbi:family 78 glycoside hydrolase catalytic domain [Microbacterium jejuense]|uniref:alpha-L-rhamnosidase n=1 Tax=Microbacterium jejuense TaxID=1263637 RepID=A0ABS7HI37_9MICO|nr:family 78 glycoside hydrolase catalytic domain [Microbacterium jejuense]MBW9092569.1 family 78 glycoside hydrolase catalytic domain [Microbacterium jejuense]
MIALDALTVEHQADPVGVDVTPRFGWNVMSDVAGTVQTSWRLTVTGPVGAVWTMDAADERCVDIEYAGPPLESLRRYRWSVAVETTAGAATGTGTFVTGVLDGDWHGAAWIGAPDPTAAAPLLRTTFAIDGQVAEAYLVVGAGGYAHAELDGAPIGPGVLAPGFTDYDVTAQYTVVDVTERLTPGAHALGLELGRGFFGMRGRNTWNWETAPWHADPCARVLLVIRSAEGVRTVVSSADWRVADGPTTFDDLYAGEDYDARRARPGWSRPGFDDTAWQAAAVVAGPRGTAVAQRQPPIEIAAVLEPVAVTELDAGRWVVSFERVIAGWVEIDADGPAGEVVELRFGETLRDDGTPNCVDEKGYFDGRFQTDTLTLAGGPVTWHPRFTWHGFQHVEVRAARLPGIRAHVVHTRAPRIGAFSSSSRLLDTLHELTVRTVLNNLHGIPTDTPKYEKNGWTGDGMLGARLMLQNLDTHELLAKWSADIAASRHGEGAPQVIAPHGGWTMDWSPAPTWHSALLLAPWELYLQRGDERVLRDVWPDARDYLRFELARTVDGIADTTLGDWVSPETDPGGGNAPEDRRVAATAFVIAMCDAAAAMARVLGESVTEWTDAASLCRAAFVERFWHEATAEVRGEGDEGYRQAHTVLALAFGLLPEDARQRAADRLARDVAERGDHLSTGALATKYLLPVLTEWGHADRAAAVALQTTFPSWGYWVEQGATSLWEHWKPESRSRGHYFLGTIDDWLFSHLAGIEPVEPGWRRARIAPRVVGHGIDRAAASLVTPYGELEAAWRLDGDEIVLGCRVPVGVTADVELPGLRITLGSGAHEVRSPAHQAE